MFAAVFSSLAVVSVAVAVAALAIPWWAVVDVASRPKESFASRGLSKRAWLVLLIVFTVSTYFVGLGLVLNYALKARPAIEQPAKANKFGSRLLTSTLVFILVIVSSTLTYGVGQVRSLLSSHTEQARVEGYIRGHCPIGGPLAEGKRFSVKLTTGYSGKIVGVATMAGNTGRTNFYFDVTPGIYMLTATSGSVSHRWSLSYDWGVRPSPQTVPVPVAMNVAVSVAC